MNSSEFELCGDGFGLNCAGECNLMCGFHSLYFRIIRSSICLGKVVLLLFIVQDA